MFYQDSQTRRQQNGYRTPTASEGPQSGKVRKWLHKQRCCSRSSVGRWQNGCKRPACSLKPSIFLNKFESNRVKQIVFARQADRERGGGGLKAK